MQQLTSERGRALDESWCRPEAPVDEGVAGRAARVLADQAMPPEEIAAILASGDSRLVHRHLELHAERLEERVAAQRRQLRKIERLLARRSSSER